jgi:formamidopyrimidine-DNA glycosylase
VRVLKPALLAQKLVAGLGNIYADEALWLARLHPEAARLAPEAAQRLHQAIGAVLARAVEAGGSTLADASYQQPDGQPGYFQLQHNVYDRAGQPCPRCGTTIVKYKLAQRGTHFCPQCQVLSL